MGRPNSTRMRGALAALAALLVLGTAGHAQETGPRDRLDRRVKAFLSEREGRWADMNVPARDGEFLHDLIVEHGYTRALEIGTSTGHSGIWIAWALSRTGGTLITIEIDPARHAEALKNFEAAGLTGFIDARLADAHELVPELPGPFDFVFSDADKDWYRQYFLDLAPKMPPGACFATHNISSRHGGLRGWVADYVEFLNAREGFETQVESTRSTGMALTYKKGR